MSKVQAERQLSAIVLAATVTQPSDIYIHTFIHTSYKPHCGMYSSSISVHTHLLLELSVDGRRLDRGVRFHVPGDGYVRQRVAGRPHPPPHAVRVVGLFDAGDLPLAGACGASEVFGVFVFCESAGGCIIYEKI